MNASTAKGAVFKISSRSEIGARLGRLLVEEGAITARKIDELRHRSTWIDQPFERVLRRSGEVPENAILNALARITGVPTVDMARIEIDPAVVELVPARTATKFSVMPLRVAGGTITMVTDHVWEAAEEDQLRVITGYSLEWLLGTSEELKECIKHYYGVGVETFLDIQEIERDGRAPAAREDEEGGVDISSFVHEIIRDAISIDATDIHIEPTEDSLRLRYRIDGVLQTFPLPAGIDHYAKAVISSVKVMAQMNIAEHRKPQDGRFSITLDQETFDIRVSVLPMQFGETLNLRILNREATFIDLERLGLAADNRAVLEEMISLPYGMILFTGPTGSGKTTSLYAALAYLNNDKRKVITLEDPIEYRIEGVTQMQMDARIGLSFASGLRSVLRHDPDIVLIGEIRDTETSDIAVSAALTGHLVFSTLHTNDSVGALTRLLDMDVEPYLVASALEGAVAQRLMRMICPHCKEQQRLDELLFADLAACSPDIAAPPPVYHGRGCPNCRFTGYRGREPIFEIMRMDDELRALTTRHSTAAELMDCAVTKKGLETLRQCGWRKVLEGRTTVEELLRVTRMER
jgi:type II secretory ATPase GspE/PulE/Tfp pilus assembly ATPase PilB-like protein